MIKDKRNSLESFIKEQLIGRKPPIKYPYKKESL